MLKLYLCNNFFAGINSLICNKVVKIRAQLPFAEKLRFFKIGNKWVLYFFG